MIEPPQPVCLAVGGKVGVSGHTIYLSVAQARELAMALADAAVAADEPSETR